jgi:hypothetical protein
MRAIIFLLKNPTKITHHSGGWDVSPQPFRRQPFRHGDVSPRPFRRHLNLITAVMINSIFTEYAIHISRNFNFILDHQSVYRSFYLYICILYLTPNIAHTYPLRLFKKKHRSMNVCNRVTTLHQNIYLTLKKKIKLFELLL